MNLNWKVRVKNPSFWVSIALAILTPILAYMGITAQDITTWSALGNVLLQAVSNPYILVMVAVSVYNAVVDPTTTGFTERATALKYTTPNNRKGARS